MPLTFLQLIRESFFRPRVAAQHILGRGLSRNVLALAALFVSIVTVLSQYYLLAFSQNMADGAWYVTFSFPFGDVALQFVGAYLVSHVVIMLARVAGIEVEFSDSLTTYLWFNFLLAVVLLAFLAAVSVLGMFAVVVVLGTLVWIPYAIAIYWSELLQTKNLFLGFGVALVAILISSAISVVVASIIGLPVMEIVQNV